MKITPSRLEYSRIKLHVGCFAWKRVASFVIEINGKVGCAYTQL